jgi:hypothetical protein
MREDESSGSYSIDLRQILAKRAGDSWESRSTWFEFEKSSWKKEVQRTGESD